MRQIPHLHNKQQAAGARTWAGELVTVTPAASSARILSWAVPLPPAQPTTDAISVLESLCPVGGRSTQVLPASALLAEYLAVRQPT